MKHKKVLISERYLYRIKDIIEETKMQGRIESDSLIKYQGDFEKGKIIENVDCHHIWLKEKKFCAKIKELSESEWYT